MNDYIPYDFNLPEEVGAAVIAYQENPSSENGEKVLALFKNLIMSYFILLRMGKSSPCTRRLERMVRKRYLSPSLLRYEDADLMQELKLCILISANKGHVVNYMPYAVMTMIKSIARDTSVRSTDFMDISEEVEERISNINLAAPVLEAEITSELNLCYTISEEEKWLLVKVVEGWSHREIANKHGEIFRDGKVLSRRRISEKIAIARGKLASELGIDDE